MKKLLMLVVLVASCGGYQRSNTLEAYEEETRRCSENIEAIVAREGTTREEDLDALRLEEVRCYDALEAIMEEVR